MNAERLQAAALSGRADRSGKKAASRDCSWLQRAPVEAGHAPRPRGYLLPMQTASSSLDLATRIRSRAKALGFDFVGIAPVGSSAHADMYRAWIEAGNAGEMGYLARPDAVEKRADPGLVVPGARSAVVVTRSYADEVPRDEGVAPDRGIFARYARNEDYHDVLKPRLIQLQEWIAGEVGPAGGRAYLDTGPILERELAQRSGLGWFGRNTLLIRPQVGSYFFLGVILLDVDLPYDAPFEDDLCGSCVRCVDACPTDALLGRTADGAPVMDARRCISYLTIELKGPIPRELRPLIGNRIYGCDICQEVCPHNHPKFVQITDESAFRPRDGVQGERLIELMRMSREEFSRRFKGSPVKRAKRRGLLRNVAVALGNWGSEEAIPVLAQALVDDEPLVRGHAAWALGTIGGSVARDALVLRLADEADEWVREEIVLATREASGGSGR